jgi:secondary thiamine-phosphate synthase enzyme
MDTLTRTSTYCHRTFRITTAHPTEFLDLTDLLQALITESGIRIGILNVQSLHTTAAIVVNECEPLLLTDFRTMLEEAAPSDRSYRHDDPALRTVNLTPDERINGHAHCRALMLAPSACLNVIDGCLQLGRWQRVLLAELDGPRERQVAFLILGEDQR